MKEYAEAFYKSRAWRDVSRLYMLSRNYVCERCGGVGAICHHKKYITPGNIGDPSVTLNPDNLECLCQECHNREHSLKRSRAVFDSEGNITGVKVSADMKEYQENLRLLERLADGGAASCEDPPGGAFFPARPQTGCGVQKTSPDET